MGSIFGFLASGFNGLIVILVSSVLSLLGGVYLGHSYEKNYYEAKISSEKVRNQDAINAAIQEEANRSALAVGQLFRALQAEQTKSQAYQSQAKTIFAQTSDGMAGRNCFVPYGFIRLWNASATGETTSPASSDAITSTIDLDTVLSATIDNHGKYREAARQVEAIKAAQ